MKKISLIVTLLVALIATTSAVSYAQLRQEQDRASDFMGPVVKQRSSQAGNLGNLFNMQMSHSYSMTFGSYGGQYQNLNAYTNTMQFFFSERLTGRLDLSLLHSPFGGTSSFINGQGNTGMGAEFVIRNAELNYQISDRSNISIQFQQVPSYGLGYGGISPFSRYHNDPYDPFTRRNY